MSWQIHSCGCQGLDCVAHREAVSSEGQRSLCGHQGMGEGHNWGINPRSYIEEAAYLRTMEDLESISPPSLIMRPHFLAVP